MVFGSVLPDEVWAMSDRHGLLACPGVTLARCAAPERIDESDDDVYLLTLELRVSLHMLGIAGPFGEPQPVDGGQVFEPRDGGPYFLDDLSPRAPQEILTRVYVATTCRGSCASSALIAGNIRMDLDMSLVIIDNWHSAKLTVKVGSGTSR